MHGIGEKIGVIFSALLLGGCSSLLPTLEQTTQSSWKGYEAARKAFDNIQPGKTRAEELWAMGFDPFKNPNINLLNYLDVTRLFVPNESIRLADLPPELQLCLQAKTDCVGYGISSGNVFRERYGSAFLDIFNFRRKTRTSGWQFQGTIILNKDLVVYKLESGRPNILEFEDKNNPLGPLQDISVPAQIPISY